MANAREPVRILVADEQSLFRQAVRVALEKESDLHVVAEARDGLDAVTQAERTRPDVALLHAALDGCDGIATTRLIKDREPNCKVLVMTDEEDPNILREAVEAGANGYLTKGSPVSELIDAVRAVFRGEMLVPPRMLGQLFDGLFARRRKQEAALRRVSRLSAREREVLSLLSRGAGNESIGRALVISPHTARTHIQRVIKKLGVHSRVEAAMLVTQPGAMDELLDVSTPYRLGAANAASSR